MKINALLRLDCLVAVCCLLTVGCQGRAVSDPLQALPTLGPATTSTTGQLDGPAGFAPHVANPVHRICCQVAPALARQSPASSVKTTSYYQDPIANEATRLQVNQFPSPEETLQQPLPRMPRTLVGP
ncbi:MAG: hypothetical protein ABGX05_10340 [Pirellulaceae bacterium]